MFSKVLALALAAAVAVQAGGEPGYPEHSGYHTPEHTTTRHYPEHTTHPGHHNVTTVTEVVDKYVTYCPEPTHLTFNNKTYTVTEACTYTITDCPCTVTRVIPTNAPTSPPNNNNNNNNNNGNKGPSPTTAPAAPPAATGTNPPLVGAAGQNTAAYGMALAGAIAAALVL